MVINMIIEKEIERAVKRIAALDTSANKKSADELNRLIAQAKSEATDLTCNFSDTSSLIIRKAGKKRFVKRYDDLYSCENILSQCIKQILDRSFKIRYPNRAKMIRELFDIMNATIKMSNFTVLKFDFKNYFNSLSATYLFEKFIKSNILDRFQLSLIEDYTRKTKYAYAGLPSSNAMAEIAGATFDHTVRQVFQNSGLIYYARYIDDCVLILNNHTEQVELQKLLDQILSDIFYDTAIKSGKKCKTKYNASKFSYISKQQLLAPSSTANSSVFDFLGYEFTLYCSNSSPKDRKVQIMYGITSAKQQKYNTRIDKLIKEYADDPSHENLELLRHRIAAFTSREVYLIKRFRSNVWRVKGFIANYGELRYFVDTPQIESKTKHFLAHMVTDAFSRAGIQVPYFLKPTQQATSGYNLLDNLKSNKSLVFVEHIGYDYRALVRLCEQIGIQTTDVNGKRRGYDTLVKEYLIKVKAGY